MSKNKRGMSPIEYQYHQNSESFTLHIVPTCLNLYILSLLDCSDTVTNWPASPGPQDFA